MTITPEEYVKQITEESGTSFYWAMRLLPKKKREAMFAIYAFSREIDDIADDPGYEMQQRLDKFSLWREEIENLYAGNPENLITAALVRPVAEYSLPKAEFLALIDGMETDGRGNVHGMSMDELKLYCRRVAGAVGMLSVRVFGEDNEVADRLAVVQGEALQFTNILRDISEDAERGRLYLPIELLEKHGIKSREPKEVAESSQLPALCRELAEIARQRYTESEKLLSQLDKRKMRPSIIMLHVYKAILDRLVVNNWREIKTPVRLPGYIKLLIAIKCLINS